MKGLRVRSLGLGQSSKGCDSGGSEGPLSEGLHTFQSASESASREVLPGRILLQT